MEKSCVSVYEGTYQGAGHKLPCSYILCNLREGTGHFGMIALTPSDLSKGRTEDKVCKTGCINVTKLKERSGYEVTISILNNRTVFIPKSTFEKRCSCRYFSKHLVKTRNDTIVYSYSIGKDLLLVTKRDGGYGWYVLTDTELTCIGSTWTFTDSEPILKQISKTDLIGFSLKLNVLFSHCSRGVYKYLTCK